ncbi:MAG: hypothetical protein WCP97_08015 [bacterium]
MTCEYCGKPTNNDETLCERCTKLHQSLTVQKQVDVETIKTRIQNCGLFIRIIGWFNLVINMLSIAGTIFSRLDQMTWVQALSMTGLTLGIAIPSVLLF